MVLQHPILPIETREVCSGLTCEWFFERRVVVYKVTRMSQRLIETWADLTCDTIEKWDKSTPYLALHDVSNPGISLQYGVLVNFDLMNLGVTTPGFERALKVFEQNPEFSAKVALGFNLTVSGQVSHKVMGISRKHPNISYRAFFTREKSLDWLHETLSPFIPADAPTPSLANVATPPLHETINSVIPVDVSSPNP